VVCYSKETSHRPQQGAQRLATLAVSDVTNAGARNMLLIAAIETPPRAIAFTSMQRVRGGSLLAVVSELCWHTNAPLGLCWSYRDIGSPSIVVDDKSELGLMYLTGFL
jgi:hypothetical protein